MTSSLPQTPLPVLMIITTRLRSTLSSLPSPEWLDRLHPARRARECWQPAKPVTIRNGIGWLRPGSIAFNQGSALVDRAAAGGATSRAQPSKQQYLVEAPEAHRLRPLTISLLWVSTPLMPHALPLLPNKRAQTFIMWRRSLISGNSLVRLRMLGVTYCNGQRHCRR